jgi:hypothetical protein
VLSVPYFAEIQSLWKEKGHSPNEPTLLAKLLLTLLIASQFLSPSICKYFFDSSRAGRREFMHVYVVLWLVLLSYVLRSSSPHAAVVFWIIPVWEIASLLLYRLYFVFVKSRLRPWTSSSIRRSLVLVILNIVEIIIAFAILFRCDGNIVNPQSSIRGLSVTSALYFSLTTITTVGMGDFVPTDDPSRLLVGAEIVSGMLMLLLIVPTLVSIVSNELQKDPKSMGS